MSGTRTGKAVMICAPCGYDAAKHAVTRWHYSKAMPAGKLVKFGVWEDDVFVGAVIFGRGATHDLLRPYGLRQTEGCELTRVALNAHKTPVSRIVSAALRELKRGCPGLKLVVSYADPAYGHLGGIYQAGNWIFTGVTDPDRAYIAGGRRYHPRTVSSVFGTVANLRRLHPETRLEATPSKFRYIYPLDAETRKRVRGLALPYPGEDDLLRLRCGGCTPGFQPGGGGSSPTRTLRKTITFGEEAGRWAR